jgi:hypothetical protein
MQQYSMRALNRFGRVFVMVCRLMMMMMICRLL